MNWRPISEAPKDGTQFLAYGSYLYPGDTSPTEYCEVACYSGDDEWPWEDAEGLHKDSFYSHFALIGDLPAPTQEKTDGHG